MTVTVRLPLNVQPLGSIVSLVSGWHPSLLSKSAGRGQDTGGRGEQNAMTIRVRRKESWEFCYGGENYRGDKKYISHTTAGFCQ